MKTKFIADKCYYEKFPALPVIEKHKLFNAAYFTAAVLSFIFLVKEFISKNVAFKSQFN